LNFTAEIKLQKKVNNFLKPPSKILPSKWSDKYRKLSPESSAEVGKWETNRTFYQREPMDCVMDPEIKYLVLMFASQTGKTDIALNIIGRFIDVDPCPMLMVQPSDKVAAAFSERFSQMVRDCSRLNTLIKEPRTRDSKNKIEYKAFPGGEISFAGANSPNNLSGRPIKLLYCDDIRGFPASAGSEGSPTDLAIRRTKTFFDALIILSSSPGMKGYCRISHAYSLSDQRVFEMPCPKCGNNIIFKWKNLKFERNKKRILIPGSIFYNCPHNNCKIDESYKIDMLSLGKWKKRAKTINSAGFWLSELYSPWVVWEEIVRDFLDSKSDPEKLKVIINTSFCETFEDKGDVPDWKYLFNRRAKYKRNELPKEGLLLVAGADVQKDRIELEIVIYGRNKISWSIDYRIISGDPTQSFIWKQIDDILDEDFRHPYGLNIKIRRIAIDSGYLATEVYMYGRKKGPDLVLVGKGMSSLNTILGHPKKVDIELAKKKKIYKGIQLYGIGERILKNQLYAYLKLESPKKGDIYPDGFCHFPFDYEEEFFKMMTAEQQKTVKTSNGYIIRYEKIRERNEALDCRVLARACASSLGMDSYSELSWDRLENSLTKKTNVKNNIKSKKRGGLSSKFK